jgi:ABC-type phosphate/phosphonate transport system substrate-binding protein
MKSLLAVSLSVLGLLLGSGLAHADEKKPFTLVVMDPLALELSCPCVKGYAQRNYHKLGEMLEKQIGRPVTVQFSESLTAALKKTDGAADLVIGKESVVRIEGTANKMPLTPIASLTGKDGKTTMNGLFVVAGKDPALTLNDLKGYRIIFGAPECDEKHRTALALLKEFNVTFEVGTDKKVETCSACSDGATTIIDLHKSGVKAATVISSYAAPLLEGCGTIKKGDLRVIGETEAVPFVVAFINEQLPQSERDTVRKALLSVGKDKELSTVLETKDGFVPFEAKKK